MKNNKINCIYESNFKLKKPMKIILMQDTLFYMFNSMNKTQSNYSKCKSYSILFCLKKY